MLIVDEPQDTSKNIQNKELKKSKRMAARTIRVMRDRTGIEREMSWVTGTKMEHTQRRFLGKSKSKAVHPLERFPIAMDTCTAIIRVL